MTPPYAGCSTGTGADGQEGPEHGEDAEGDPVAQRLGQDAGQGRGDRVAPQPTRRLAALKRPSMPSGTADWMMMPADLAVAIDLRTGLRAMTLANNGVPAPAEVAAAFTRPLARFPLSATPAGLVGEPPFGAVVAGYAYGVATGEFARMRQCPAGDCSWVFWDSSAKGARKWCTMGVCGNRAKARAYAARRRT